MKSRIYSVIMGLGFAIGVFSLPASAAFLFPDDSCNLNGLPHIKDGTRSDVFDRRFSNSGKGNGGESLDVVVLVDRPATDGGPDPYDIALSCVKTADEDTGSTVSIGLWNDGDIIILITNFDDVREFDPNTL